MTTAAKIHDRDSFVATIKEWQEQGLEVVFTNGCFDILHLGHIDYLEKSRALGQKLVVALNTDASVSGLKGPSRPINNEFARQRMMACLEFVDAVTLFGESTPLELIQLAIPDVLVKGDDYSIDTIVGAKEVLDNGGRVETISLVKGYSTTTLIEKMKK